MAYSEKAKSLRRCEAIKPDGERCRNYSLLVSNLCAPHFYPRRRRAVIGRHEPILSFIKRKGKAHHVRQRHNVCRCRAYNWPHRAGGGLCRWPDEPLQRLNTPQGARKKREKIKEMVRKAAGVNMSIRGVTDSISFERQGDVEEIKKTIPKRSAGNQRSAIKLERKSKGGGFTPDW
jgi:hypothetical protein